MTDTPNNKKERPAKVTITEQKFNESASVCFGQLFRKASDGQVFQLNLTTRGNTAAEAIESFIDGIAYASARYDFSASRPDVESGPGKPVNQPASLPPAEAPGSFKTPAPAGAPANPPANGNGTTGAKMVHSVYLEIIPEEDDKVTVKWYGNDMRQPHNEYPNIYTKRTADKILELLQSTGEDWQPEHLTKKRSFNTRHMVLYVDSDKVNSKGNHYKNIVSLRSE